MRALSLSALLLVVACGPSEPAKSGAAADAPPPTDTPTADADATDAAGDAGTDDAGDPPATPPGDDSAGPDASGGADQPTGADQAGSSEPPADAPPGGPAELVALVAEVEAAHAAGDAKACEAKIDATAALARKLHAMGPTKGPRADALGKSTVAFRKAMACFANDGQCDKARDTFSESYAVFKKPTPPGDSFKHVFNAMLAAEGAKCE